VQGLQNHIGGLTALQRSSHHAAAVQIEHDRQIGEAFHRADISDVRHAGGSESAGAGGKVTLT